MLLKNCKEYTLDLGIYIHVSGTHNTIRKGKEKGKVNNLNNYTLSNSELLDPPVLECPFHLVKHARVTCVQEIGSVSLLK